MANLRRVFDTPDGGMGEADEGQGPEETGGWRARMPVPLYTPDGGGDQSAPSPMTSQMRNPITPDYPDGPGDTPIEPSLMDQAPAGPSPAASRKGQSSESPRDREMTSAPRMPAVPTPQAGASSEALDASAGVIPFAPMPGSSAQAQVMPQGPAPVGVSLRGPASLFGSSGGLTGGGLGMPQDPTTRANNGSIDGLMQLIRQLQQGQ